MPRVTVIITNHNYARFLGAAIDSALQQTGADVEVIVVDDGSTDASREVIATYAGRVQAILKERGGQASAFNAGFRASRGDIVIFLDADDTLLAMAAATAAELLSTPDFVKVHWPLGVIDELGQSLDRCHPTTRLPQGDLRQQLIEQGPWMCENPPTSGNAWRREMLEEVLPMPEDAFRLCADAYLLSAAPLLGKLKLAERPLSCYRIHSDNNYWNRPFEQQLTQSMEAYDRQCAALSSLLRARGVKHDFASWWKYSWWHRLERAVNCLTGLIPEGSRFALADEDQWGTPEVLRGRIRIPFPPTTHGYCGPPVSDADAMLGLKNVRAAGAQYLAIGWPAMWYFDHYDTFARHLRKRQPLYADDRELVIYSMA